jgi:hypothetical protein
MHAVAHAGARSVTTIEEAFGHPLADLFERFEMEPIASGSVAQVGWSDKETHPPSQRRQCLTLSRGVHMPELPLLRTQRVDTAVNSALLSEQVAGGSSV